MKEKLPNSLKELIQTGKKINQKDIYNLRNKLLAKIKMPIIDISKYQKITINKTISLPVNQFTLAIFEQEKYIHIVCVYAKIVRGYHDLFKNKAVEEFDRIEQFIRRYQLLKQKLS